MFKSPSPWNRIRNLQFWCVSKNEAGTTLVSRMSQTSHWLEHKFSFLSFLKFLFVYFSFLYINSVKCTKMYSHISEYLNISKTFLYIFDIPMSLLKAFCCKGTRTGDFGKNFGRKDKGLNFQIQLQNTINDWKKLLYFHKGYMWTKKLEKISAVCLLCWRQNQSFCYIATVLHAEC